MQKSLIILSLLATASFSEAPVVAQTYQFRHHLYSVYGQNEAPSEENGPLIATTSIPDGVVNQTYEAQIEAAAGDSPELTFSSGNKPAWMSLHPVTGNVTELSGIPIAPGTSSFSVTVTDGANKFDSKPFIITVKYRPCDEAVSVGDLCEDSLIYIGTHSFSGPSYRYFMMKEDLGPMPFYIASDPSHWAGLEAALGPDAYFGDSDGFGVQAGILGFTNVNPSVTTPSAATACAEANVQGYDDWYAPSHSIIKKILPLGQAALEGEPYNYVPDPAQYWTTHTFGSSGSSISMLNVTSASSPGLMVAGSAQNPRYVRCVRRDPA
ncbi:putative Ig domain-containing protein [Thalassospira xianhensis]|uniref:Dystroglycan-type cadherin-like domain-containing protein n=1 Tax=Thalassospira xianhensis MCCC 1A02616 TaxID=1177929 RepID=A0A367UDL9_9PROT|nr:putative Ig domain-containing protein [Thalassospira xianhensis]RCK06328.1 hypothetical protein TH5_09000 [Thalassospira xianhensis MCCC 1A02616]